MDLGRGSRKTHTKVVSGEHSIRGLSGLVWNHAQIRGAKAEPGDTHDETRDQLKIASNPWEENKESQPKLAKDVCLLYTSPSPRDA